MGVKVVGCMYDEIKASNHRFISNSWTTIEWNHISGSKKKEQRCQNQCLCLESCLPTDREPADFLEFTRVIWYFKIYILSYFHTYFCIQSWYSLPTQVINRLQWSRNWGSAVTLLVSSLQSLGWMWLAAQVTTEQMLKKRLQALAGAEVHLILLYCQPKGTSSSHHCPTCPRTIIVWL